MAKRLYSLRYRLLLLVVIVLVITGGIAAVLASQAITQRFQQYVLHREEESMARRQTLVGVLPALLGTYYACQMGWDGVETLLSPLGDVSEERLVLVDGAGRIVVDSAQLSERGAPAAALAAGAASIEVDGGSVGSLAVVPLKLESYSSGERAYIAQVNRALLWAVLVAGALGVALTLTISRRILKPVEALTAAVRGMERGELQQRVDVHSRDEIGELAHAFNAMADSLARAEQLRRSMVGDVAHELRTPLSNIRGYLEAVLDGVVEPRPQMVASLHEEVMLLSRLINDLQELALADAGQLKLYFQEISLAEIVEKVANVVNHPGNGDTLSFSVEIPPDLPLVAADPERVGQVLRNLLNNAFVYTPPGGVVVLRARAINAEVEVAVRNSGGSIPPEHLPYLFERFYRADRSRTRSTGGSGLGLAIVKQLIEAHGGRVWVENVPGWGVQFAFTLPVVMPLNSRTSATAG